MVAQLGLRGDPGYRTVREDRIIAWLLLNGWACDLADGDEGRLACEARDALNRWVSQGLPCGMQAGERVFDPAEVMNFFVLAGSRNEDPFWEEHYIATGRKLVLAHHQTDVSFAAPPAPASLGTGRFAVTLLRDFNLDAHLPGSRVHLRLPVPWEDESLCNLATAPIAPPEIGVDFSIAPGRLDATLAVPPRRSVTLGLEMSFTAHPALTTEGAAQLATADFELYTRPREGLVNVSDRIRGLAGELAGDLEASSAVQRFWSFMLESFHMGAVHYDELNPAAPTDRALETGWFDCQMASALLVALCRARGIPARMISGYLLFTASPTYHYWAEIWLPERGWMPFDPTCIGLSANGRDHAWRDYFVGQLDYRMKTQCLPRLFDKSPSLHMPRSWHLLTRRSDGGAETGIFANGSGAFVYRDRVSVRRVADPLQGSAIRTG